MNCGDSKLAAELVEGLVQIVGEPAPVVASCCLQPHLSRKLFNISCSRALS